MKRIMNIFSWSNNKSSKNGSKKEKCLVKRCKDLEAELKACKDKAARVGSIQESIKENGGAVAI